MKFSEFQRKLEKDGWYIERINPVPFKSCLFDLLHVETVEYVGPIFSWRSFPAPVSKYSRRRLFFRYTT